MKRKLFLTTKALFFATVFYAGNAWSQVTAPQISAANCGTTLEYLNTQYIAADPVAGAEEYEFRITSGAYTATATDNLQAGKVRIIQFAGYEYNTTYQVDARVRVGGVWSDFGPACSITTTSSPHSEIQASQCGTTLPALDSYIYTTSVNGASKYRFRVTNGGNVQVIERTVRTFQLTMLPAYDYNTTYSVEVAVQFGGLWWPYSTACNVTTPALGTSQVVASQCGATLPAASSSVFSSSVIGATGYRYRITKGDDIQTIDKTTPSFKFTDLAAYAFSATYSVEVAIRYGGTWRPFGPACTVSTPGVPVTQIQSSQCGIALPSMTTYIYADAVSGATAYRFRYTEGANAQTYTSATRSMNVTMLGTQKASTTYTVEVAVQVNNTWSAYGPACSITTPAVPTQVKAEQCGTTLAKIDKLIYADAVPYATGYRFRVTNGASVQTIDRPVNTFYLTQLASSEYATTYSVEVAVQYGGIWQPFAGACNITTPAAGVATTTLKPALCGTQVSSNSQPLEAVKVLNATQYEFLVENAPLGYSQAYTTAAFSFSLSQLAGIQPYTDYTVKVRTLVNGTWSPYGAACSITSANASSMALADGNEAVAKSMTTTPVEFDVVTFPNPFVNGFGIAVSTAGTEPVSVTVYDMSGKVLDAQTLSAEALSNLNLGESYTGGMYQVHVVQGTESKTLKVVKQ